MSLTVDIYVAPLVAFVRQNGLKFYPAMIWTASRVINAHDEFKYGWDAGGSLIRWDTVSPSYAHFHPEDQAFTKMVTPYVHDLAAFHAQFLRARARCRELRAIVPKQPPTHFDLPGPPCRLHRHFYLTVFYAATLLPTRVARWRYIAASSR